MAAVLGQRLSAVVQASRKFEPAGEIGRDASLNRYVAFLSRIVAQKDESALLTELPPTFRVEFDGGKGPVAFRRRWRSQSPESGVWKVLGRLFAMGGTFYSPTLFAIPYVYTRFPIDLDPYDYVAALKNDVPVRSQASSNASVIGKFSWELIRVSPRLKPPVRLDTVPWVGVTTAAGAAGFVNSEEVYSPAGHRVFFEQRKGKWRWISLVCAD
jgi:hypothetical protein